MKALLRIVGLVVAAGLAACEPLDDLDLGGGGTGGGSFSRGFVFVRNGGNGRNVFAVDDTGDPNFPLQLSTQGGAYYPTVSRNGRQVAFVHRSGSVYELQVVPTTGQGQPSTVFSSTNTAACSGGCTDFRYPTFSPNGQTIVFTLKRGTSTLLARVNADGSGFQLLPNSGGYFFGPASYTADGLGLIAAGSRSSSSDFELLLHVNLMSGLANVIGNVLGSDGAQAALNRVAVSPDGTKVTFDARTNTGSRVFVGKINGQSQVYDIKQVTGKLGAQDTYPSWRGNTELVFLSDEGGNDNVYRISASSERGSGNLVLVVPSAMEPFFGG